MALNGKSATPPKKKGRSRDKLSKGLRHFSTRVCKKVEEKGKTSFNEVADEIVHDFFQSQESNPDGKPHNEKNIRRRVYDALNVLMAMNVITKKRKAIVWKGLPSNAQHDLELLQRRVAAAENSVKEKKRHLQELLFQAVMYTSLISRNKGTPVQPKKESRIPVPFIIVNTETETKINIEMSENQHDIFFNFSRPFEIHDYNEILKGANIKPQRDHVESLIPRDMLHLLPPNIYKPISPQPATAPSSDSLTGVASLLTTLSSPVKKRRFSDLSQA